MTSEQDFPYTFAWHNRPWFRHSSLPLHVHRACANVSGIQTELNCVNRYLEILLDWILEGSRILCNAHSGSEKAQFVLRKDKFSRHVVQKGGGGEFSIPIHPFRMRASELIPSSMMYACSYGSSVKMEFMGTCNCLPGNVYWLCTKYIQAYSCILCDMVLFSYIWNEVLQISIKESLTET